MAAKKKTRPYISHGTGLAIGCYGERLQPLQKPLCPACLHEAVFSLDFFGRSCMLSLLERFPFQIQTFPITSPAISNILHHQSFKIILKSFSFTIETQYTHLGRLNLGLSRKQPKTQHRSRLSRFLLNLFNLSSIVIYGQSPHLRRSNKPKTKTF